MAKFLALWRYNPNAPWPMDPEENVKMTEMMLAMTDELIKKGEILEFGIFPNGTSGYAIEQGESKDEARRALTFFPFLQGEVYEMIPWETAKEILRGVAKAQAEAMAAMKR